MHRPFPEVPAFTGINQPRRIEADVFDLEIEGRLPPELNGAFYRCGPDPRFAPIGGDDININGDGMVAMFALGQGHADFRSRYVRTEKFERESAARRALFGVYRNPYTDDPSVAGADRTTANTSVVFHGQKLFALKEDGLPYQLDPLTLETRGRHDFAGKLESVTSSAHPKIDPETGDYVSFGYEARGLATRDMSYHVADRTGALVREEFFQAPYVSFQHDFVVTEHYAVFVLMPTTADDARMREGGHHWAFDPSLPSWIGILPRDGSARDLRWFEAPTQGIGHVLNGFDDGGKLYIDLFVSTRGQFPFIANLDGSPFDREKATPRLTRWTFDLSRRDGGLTAQTMFPDFMEMPRTDDRYQTRPHRYGYTTIVDPTRPLNVAGTIGVGWNTLARVDLATGAIERWYAGDRTTAQEPQFVPRTHDAPEGDGWLLAVLTRFDGDWKTELAVFDAQHIAEGPIARVKMPFRLRGGVHGSWVPAETLAQL